jgi:CMP-2-keto-3-deoxyoctulosonic acid synthetase
MLKSRLERFSLAMFLLICLILAWSQRAWSDEPPATDVQQTVGVVVIVANRHIQEFIFISEKGRHVSMTEEECSKSKDRIDMAAALLDAKQVEMIDIGDCPTHRPSDTL